MSIIVNVTSLIITSAPLWWAMLIVGDVLVWGKGTWELPYFLHSFAVHQNLL